jgi:hypothetical protein
MVDPLPGGGVTRLYFGSAVVTRTGQRRKAARFRALLGFHRGYSRALLAAAKSRLTAS